MPLIKYSRKEIKHFLNTISKHDKIHLKIDVRLGFLEVSLNKDEIKKILLNKIDCTDICVVHGYIYLLSILKIKSFLFNEPLNRVPLYINELSIFVIWRLRIAK